MYCWFEEEEGKTAEVLGSFLSRLSAGLLEDLVVDALDFITVKTDLADKYQNEIT
jgi:tRNA A37 threonylcarbamoyladenosine dehydratase